MQDQLRTIREACIKNDSSILDLKFGCQVYIDYGDGSPFYATICDSKALPGNDGWTSFKIVGRDHDYFVDDKGVPQLDVKEIIGRKIGMCDILYMFDQTLSHDELVKAMNMEKYNTIAFVGKIINLWNWKNDDITHQSPECVAFIYELLK